MHCSRASDTFVGPKRHEARPNKGNCRSNGNTPLLVLALTGGRHPQPTFDRPGGSKGDFRRAKPTERTSKRAPLRAKTQRGKARSVSQRGNAREAAAAGRREAVARNESQTSAARTAKRYSPPRRWTSKRLASFLWLFGCNWTFSVGAERLGALDLPTNESRAASGVAEQGRKIFESKLQYFGSAGIN
uniref:Uncharacterized protein n=1 Tax=Trichuris muris TaxID=70415 RepID=A0A5S6PZG7_TRIMR